MKPAKLATLMWLATLVLPGALGAILWRVYNEAATDRQASARTIANLTSTIPVHDWQPSTGKTTFDAVGMRLSPIARPTQPEPEEIEPPPQVKVEKTDQQLKDELEAELNRRFTLLRMILSNDERYASCAFLVSGGTRLQWFEDMDLTEDYARSRSSELRNLACDLRVLSIDKDGVLVDAASFEKPDRRFEVRLTVNYEPGSMSVDAGFARQEEVLRPEGRPLQNEYDGDAGKAWQWGYPLPEEPPFNEADIDDFSKYVKATDKGLQVLPQLPEDSPARKYGARGGEIIKTINGLSVKSMSDVRRIVRTQYDDGAREFVVGFERDGVPGTRTIAAHENADD